MIMYPLEPGRDEMRAIAERALDFVVDFISSLPDAPHVDLDRLPEALARIRSDAPETGTGFDELIDQIALGARKAFNPAGPGYMAFIPGGGLFTAGRLLRRSDAVVVVLVNVGSENLAAIDSGHDVAAWFGVAAGQKRHPIAPLPIGGKGLADAREEKRRLGRRREALEARGVNR